MAEAETASLGIAFRPSKDLDRVSVEDGRFGIFLSGSLRITIWMEEMKGSLDEVLVMVLSSNV